MSRSKKGVNTFFGYQEEKQRGREALIEDYLASLKKMRMKFKHVSQLAEMVAAHISQAEKIGGSDRNCYASTLLRNIRYKPLLLSYMATGMAAGKRRETKHGANDSVRDMALAEARLDAINLRSENQRLKSYIAQLEAAAAHNEKATHVLDNSGASSGNTAMAELQYKYAQTSKSLLLVLQRLDLYAEVDRDAKLIVDRSIRRGDDRIIACSEEAGPFCEWLNANSFLIGS